MDVKEVTQKAKDFAIDKKDKIVALPTSKKIALGVLVAALTVAGIFGFKYIQESKYTILFSGLNSDDALAVTQELESMGASMKIKGDTIYVLKDQVDKLRIQLSPSITGGSKGFELFDESSSFGLTDEEFELKKLRVMQGELEKTIKTFPQVQDARVHITQGQKSVFVDESIEGSAAVYVSLKTGKELTKDQVRSIMSLVSASGFNIPKQNVEVIDQSMNLLSEGLFDDEGNAINSSESGLDLSRNAEKQLNSDLEKSIKSLLEPIFGKGKVSVSVNSDLNFDTSEVSELIIDPERVAILEDRKESTSEAVGGNSGGTIDDNMSQEAQDDGSSSTSESKEEHLEFTTGKTETKTIKAQGEIKRITASIAINSEIDAGTMRDIEALVANAVGLDAERGDKVAVVAMNFNPQDLDKELAAEEQAKKQKQNFMIFGVIAIIALIGVIAFMVMKKKKAQEAEEAAEENEIEMINKQLEEMEKIRIDRTGEDDDEGLSLEEEVKKFSEENPEQVTEIINKWLND